MPAKPEETFICPQLSKEKGIAFENKPKPKQCNKIFFPFGSLWLGNLLPVKMQIRYNITAANVILIDAMVRGLKFIRASSTPRKDIPQIIPREINNSQLKTVLLIKIDNFI